MFPAYSDGEVGKIEHALFPQSQVSQPPMQCAGVFVSHDPEGRASFENVTTVATQDISPRHAPAVDASNENNFYTECMLAVVR